jgi:hypothetical protein
VLPVSDLPHRTIWLIRSEANEYVDGAPLGAFHMQCDKTQSPVIIINYSSTAETPSAQKAADLAINASPSVQLFVVPSRDIKGRAEHSTTPEGAGASTVSVDQPADDAPDESAIETYDSCKLSSPACDARNRPNVISVAAVAQDGQTASNLSLHGSGYEVAALGDVSTISAGGTPSRLHGYGSSYAVPYVSALASLIFNQYQVAGGQDVVTAADLKVRILATADLTSDPRTSFAFGPINFTRALQVESDHVAYSNGEDACGKGPSVEVDGELVDTGDFTSNKSRELYGGPTRTVFDASTVLRIKRHCGANNANPEFDVVIQGPAVNAKIPLAQAFRYVQVDLSQRELQFQTPSGITRIPLYRLRDYVACMRPYLRPTNAGCLNHTRRSAGRTVK